MIRSSEAGALGIYWQAKLHLSQSVTLTTFDAPSPVCAGVRPCAHLSSPRGLWGPVPHAGKRSFRALA